MSLWSTWAIDANRSGLDPSQWTLYRARAPNGTWEYDFHQYSRAIYPEYGPRQPIGCLVKFTLLIRYSPHQLLSYLNSRAPDQGGAEAAEAMQQETPASLDHTLLGQFQNLHLAQSTASRLATNPFANSRSPASSASNPFRSPTNSSQSRSAPRPLRSATPAPRRSPYNSTTYQPAYPSVNVGPYAAPTGSVGYHAVYGQPEQGSGPLLDPRSIHRSATAQPSLSKQAAERS